MANKTLPIDVGKKTDEELVGLILENQDFFVYIIERYESKLKRYINRISSPGADELEDILQEIFIKVYKNLNGFDQELKFSSWIYRIAHNEAINHFRHQKARPQTINLEWNENFINQISSDLDLAKETDQELLKKQTGEILNKMDIKYREVLTLKFLEEKDYKEISDILKKPMGTVATLINRAKKKFQIEVGKQKHDLRQ